jgi:hypothetical protein
MEKHPHVDSRSSGINGAVCRAAAHHPLIFCHRLMRYRTYERLERFNRLGAVILHAAKDDQTIAWRLNAVLGPNRRVAHGCRVCVVGANEFSNAA